MRKLSFALVVLIAIFFLVGCESNINKGDEISLPTETISTSSGVIHDFDLDEYKLLVSECRSSINNASIYISNMGAYEIKYWKILGSLSDTMVDSAFKWLAEKSDGTRDSVETSYETIRKQFKEIVLIEIDGNEAEEISKSFRSMYDSYIAIYLMVTSPSGTVESFATKLNNNINNITDSNNTLSLFLD